VSTSAIVADSEASVTMFGAEALPMELSRNVYVDNQLSLKVHVVGARLGNRYVVNKNVSFYTELVGKVLGYRMRQHLDESLGGFSGVSVGELGAEFGAAFQLGEVALRIFVGGDADLALGGSGGKFAVHSDLGAYAGLALDI